MPAESRGIAGGASIILLGTAPFLVYHGTFGVASAWLVGAVAAAQITTIAWLVTGKWAIRYRVSLAAGLLAIAAAVSVLPGLSALAVGLAMAGFGHAVAYSSLLIWFATSLRPGREPVVTGIARRVRRTMPDKVMRYTRRVTIAWCVFFAAQLVASATLLLTAPATVWSGFVTLLNLPLVTAMVLAEFGYRLILFRHEPHTGLIDTLSALRHTRFVRATRP
jgi:uncharacterized membrane protein